MPQSAMKTQGRPYEALELARLSGLEYLTASVTRMPQNRGDACNTPKIKGHIKTLASISEDYACLCLHLIRELYMPVLPVGQESLGDYVQHIEDTLRLFAGAPALKDCPRTTNLIFEYNNEYPTHSREALKLIDRFGPAITEATLSRFNCVDDGLPDAIEFFLTEPNKKITGAKFRSQIVEMHHAVGALQTALAYGPGATPCYIFELHPDLSRRDADKIEIDLRAKKGKEIGYNPNDSPIKYIINRLRHAKQRQQWDVPEKWISKIISSIDVNKKYSLGERAPVIAVFMAYCCPDRLGGLAWAPHEEE